MAAIQGLFDIGSGIRANRQSRRATNQYVNAVKNLEALPEYQSPEFYASEAAQLGPTERAQMFGAGDAMGEAEQFFAGYEPVDIRDTAYAGVRQQAADAINMAGGRRPEQRRAAERVITAAAPAIEADFAGRQERLAFGKAGAGQDVQRLGTGIDQFNVGEGNMANRYQAGLTQQANLDTSQRRTDFGQTEADRLYQSAVASRNQPAVDAGMIYDARTGQAIRSNQLMRQVGSGAQAVGETAAQAAMLPGMPLGNTQFASYYMQGLGG